MPKQQPKKKVNLRKEAAEVLGGKKEDGIITDEILFEYCPKQFLAEFKKAKSLGQRADLLYKVDKARLDKQKEAEIMSKFTFRLERLFIQELPEKDATGIAGKLARVQVVKKERPYVADWSKFYGYIKKRGEFELLNRAPNARAIKERWEAGKAIPGVDKSTYRDISLTKVK